MGRLVDLTNVMLALDNASKVRFGAHVTSVMQNAVRDLPSPPFVPSPNPSEAASQKRAAFQDVFAQGEDLIESMDKLAKWMKDAETDDIVELQRIAKRVSSKVDQLAGLKGDHLRKQYNTVMTSRN